MPPARRTPSDCTLECSFLLENPGYGCGHDCMPPLLRRVDPGSVLKLGWKPREIEEVPFSSMCASDEAEGAPPEGAGGDVEMCWRAEALAPGTYTVEVYLDATCTGDEEGCTCWGGEPEPNCTVQGSPAQGAQPLLVELTVELTGEAVTVDAVIP